MNKNVNAGKNLYFGNVFVGGSLICMFMFCSFLSPANAAGCASFSIDTFGTDNQFVQGGYNGFEIQQEGGYDCLLKELVTKENVGLHLFKTLQEEPEPLSINNLRGEAPVSTILVAHRGGPEWANKIPDNSVPAFINSIVHGVSSVEVDVQMDSNRNLIAFHDSSFAGGVHVKDNETLKKWSRHPIADHAWITENTDKTLNDTNLDSLKRVVPIKFIKHRDGVTLELDKNIFTDAQDTPVSSLDKVLYEIQKKSMEKFKSGMAVNIFLDAAKSKDITIATINRLRRFNMYRDDVTQQYIPPNFSYNNKIPPQTPSIAVQFRINHFPMGGEDLVKALCSSPENAIRYRREDVYMRTVQQENTREGMWYLTRWRVLEEWWENYSDSSDAFLTKYPYKSRERVYYSDTEVPGIAPRVDKTDISYLWGDPATCDANTIASATPKINLVPVLESTLPYAVGTDTKGEPITISNEGEAEDSIERYMKTFENIGGFSIEILEISLTPLDVFKYYSSKDQTVLVNTTMKWGEIVDDLRAKHVNSRHQKYIYQTFNRFFDFFVVGLKKNVGGNYLCSSKLDGERDGDGIQTYSYLCNKVNPASAEEALFEYRAKPGYYSNACGKFNISPPSKFVSKPYGIVTTDNPMLELHVKDNPPNYLCYPSGDENEIMKMREYTANYDTFVGNPSFRLDRRKYKKVVFE